MAAPTRTPRERWISAGLTALAAGGPRAVRVEALAKDLGVTKGGFYGFFSGRDELLEAMLDQWEHESIDETIEAARREGGDARARIHRMGRMTFSDERLLPIDLAIRDWARQDDAVATRLRRVDTRRMEELRGHIGTFCDDADEVEARSLLAFCAAIGSHFLAAEHGGRTRQEVLDRAAEIILTPTDS